jgi:hypothetical protein
MARSSYIYLLYELDDSGHMYFMGAWTVKHEMISFTKRNGYGNYKYRRLRDGGELEIDEWVIVEGDE